MDYNELIDEIKHLEIQLEDARTQVAELTVIVEDLVDTLTRLEFVDEDE